MGCGGGRDNTAETQNVSEMPQKSLPNCVGNALKDSKYDRFVINFLQKRAFCFPVGFIGPAACASLVVKREIHGVAPILIYSNGLPAIHSTQCQVCSGRKIALKCALY